MIVGPRIDQEGIFRPYGLSGLRMRCGGIISSMRNATWSLRSMPKTKGKWATGLIPRTATAMIDLLLVFLDRIGMFMLRLPSRLRGSRARQGGEHAPVRADDGVDEVGGTW